MKRKLVFLVFIIGIIGFGLPLYRFLYPFLVEKAARVELLDFQKSVFIGDSVDQFKKRFKEKNYRYLDLVGNQSRWTCETPYQIGAKNWILFIDLNGGKVARTIIRTPDNGEILPNGAVDFQGIVPVFSQRILPAA